MQAVATSQLLLFILSGWFSSSLASSQNPEWECVFRPEQLVRKYVHTMAEGVYHPVHEGSLAALLEPRDLHQASCVLGSVQTVRRTFHESGMRTWHPLVSSVHTAWHHPAHQDWLTCLRCTGLMLEEVHSEPRWKMSDSLETPWTKFCEVLRCHES